jgi:hypothetical protein
VYDSLRSDGPVKGIHECLARETVYDDLSSLAVVNGLLVGVASVDQSVADELGDNLWVQGAPVVKVCLVGGLERVLLATIETRPKHDSRIRALVEVGGVGEGGRTGSTTRSSRDVGEVSLEAKSGVECVSLSTTLQVLGGSGTRLASVDRGNGSLAPVSKDVADRVEHNLGVESTTLRKFGLVHRFERVLSELATLERGAELDSRVRTAAQVEATRRYRLDVRLVVSGSSGRGQGGGGGGG